MDTQIQASTDDYEFSEYAHCWETGDEWIFFDALSLGVVKASVESPTEAIRSEDTRDELLDAGIIYTGDAPEADTRQTADERWEYFREPSFNTLYLILTRNCNLDCEYCFLPPTQRRMDPDAARRAVDLLLEADDEPKSIIFYGGEPLLEFDLLRELVERSAGEVDYALVTNGTLLDDEHAEFLSEHEFNVSVSVDGPPEMHDRMRTASEGGATFEDVSEGIRTLEDHGVPYNISCTVGEHNVERLPEVVSYLHEEFDHGGIGLSFPRLAGRGEGASATSVSADQLADAWLELIDKYANDELPTLPTNVYDRWIRPLAKQTPARLYCGGCRTNLVLNTDGRIGPCMVAKDERFLDDEGDGLFWRELDEFDSFSDIAESGFFEEWQRTLPYYNEACHHCPGFMICGGGCPYNGYVEMGDLQRPEPKYCEFVRTVLMDVIEQWG